MLYLNGSFGDITKAVVQSLYTGVFTFFGGIPIPPGTSRLVDDAIGSILLDESNGNYLLNS